MPHIDATDSRKNTKQMSSLMHIFDMMPLNNKIIMCFIADSYIEWDCPVERE